MFRNYDLINKPIHFQNYILQALEAKLSTEIFVQTVETSFWYGGIFTIRTRKCIWYRTKLVNSLK